MSTEPNLESKKDWREELKAITTEFEQFGDIWRLIDEKKAIKFIEDLLADKEREFIEDLEKIEEQFIHTDERYGRVKSIRTQLNTLIDKFKYHG